MEIRNLSFIYIFQFCLVVFAQKSSGQNVSNYNLNFHLLDVSSGLSHNFVNDITQDSLGFIWVGTYDGLNRYDGSSFLQFKKELKKPLMGLSNNYVQALEVLPQGILIATDAGLNTYNLRSGKFDILNSENGLYNNSVSSIKKFCDNNLLVGTYRGGLQIVNQKKEVISLPDFFGINNELSFNEISSIVIQNDSLIWVGSFNNGLDRISLRTGEITHSSKIKGLDLTSAVINILYVDSKNNLWIGTRRGLKILKNDGKVLSLSKSKAPSFGLSDDEILSLQEDRNGQMWIGTRNGGLNILDIKSLNSKKLLNRWYLPDNSGKSVFNRTVSVIFRDKQGNMWLGTPTGINFVNPKGEKIQLLTHQNLKGHSLSHDRIGSIAKADKNKVWIGTDGAGLDLLDPQKGKVKHFEHSGENSLSNNYLLSIYQQSPDSVWVGTYQGGLNLLNPKTGDCRHYLQGSTEEGSDVRVIYRASNGKLWVGTNRGGLYKYIRGKDQFQYIDNLGKIDVRDIAEDKNGILWLATYGSGIIKFEPETRVYNTYLQSNLPKLNSNVIFSIIVLPDGDILAGTRYAGLIRLDPETNRIDHFTETDGLSNNTVNSLVIEDDKFVWMGSYNGLNRYNIRTNEILNISALDNIQEGEFNIGAAEINRDGVIYIGGNNGLNIFNPKDFKADKNDFPVVFEGIKVLNEEVKVAENGEKSILEETIFFQDEIKLASNQNSFSIDFAALKYPEAKNINYSYKLENYNDFWIDNRTSGTANFTSVPPGEYYFIVKTNSGLENQLSKRLKIVIIPPFWKTLPAFVLYTLIAIFLIWISSRYYSERLKLKNSLLFEKKQRILEHDINEERFRFFTAFSHELKTPLTLILAPVENLLSKKLPNENRKDLIFIYRNAQNLYRSINKLLEFRKAEEGLSQLKNEPVDLPAKMRKLVKNYVPLAKEKEIQIEFSGPIEPKIFIIDIEKMEVILNNLLSNAIKYSDKGGRVKISFSDDETGFQIQVQDSGPGINAKDISHIFEWYYRSESITKKSGTGIGLALSKRFAQLHGGSIEVSSEECRGTIFTVSIPVKMTNLYMEGVSIEELKIENYPIEKLANQKISIKPEIERSLILIIDDNEEILQFLKRIFQPDYDLVFAVNGREGIEKAKRYIPDIIISDVMMPEKSGLYLCSELKNEMATSHIPIILLTAKTAVDNISHGYQEGADDYITKPFNPGLLKTRVKNLLAGREKLKQYFTNKLEPNPNEENSPLVLRKEKLFLKDLNVIILAHMNDNNDSVENIAQGAGMSRTSLYRKLKAITGLNINEYIRNFKIERAAHLIQFENYSVSQASFEVGFGDVKYFRKIFKGKYGKNPSELKQEN
ncbi:hybrid sensor histidine kinase/response regulator transcription factor [Christiangramia fulva]|nr:hybrid sensor histidine kinase/response regulator transcription factor [Christiangramia fulva]